MFDLFLGRFRKQDDETKQIIRYNDYMTSFLDDIVELYSIECDEFTQDSCDLIRYAMINGHMGTIKVGDKYFSGIGSYTGNLDADGRGKEYIVTLQNGETYKGTIGKDVVVFAWNNTRTSIYPKLDRASEFLADIDLSLNMNLKYSRVCPIPIVSTEQEEKSMQKVLSDLWNGCTKIFKRTQAVDLSGVKKEDVLNLTNPETAVYLQNLSRLHDDIMRRTYMEFGIEVTNKDKGAQLNTEELTQNEDLVALKTSKTFNKLKKYADDCKKVFGIDVRVSPNNALTTEKDIETTENEVDESEGENE